MGEVAAGVLHSNNFHLNNRKFKFSYKMNTNTADLYLVNILKPSSNNRLNKTSLLPMAHKPFTITTSHNLHHTKLQLVP